MSRPIDADALIPDFIAPSYTNREPCKKYVSMEQIHNAPTIEPEITQEDIELYCRRRCLTVITDELYNEMKMRWSAQPEKAEYIQDTKAVPDDRDMVCLSERVTATYYDDEHEEWSQKTVTIADVLDSVCDDYTVLPSTQPKQQWIPVGERLPKCEQEVLICTKKKLVGRDACIDSIITPAIYEDGTMLENDSSWQWEDVDWAGWDDEEDCGIIPEGWWENRSFNQDDVYNNPVDQEVVAWMPLPEPYKEPI